MYFYRMPPAAQLLLKNLYWRPQRYWQDKDLVDFWYLAINSQFCVFVAILLRYESSLILKPSITAVVWILNSWTSVSSLKNKDHVVKFKLWFHIDEKLYVYFFIYTLFWMTMILFLNANIVMCSVLKNISGINYLVISLAVSWHSFGHWKSFKPSVYLQR